MPFRFFDLPRELRDTIYDISSSVRVFDTSLSTTREVACRPENVEPSITAYIPHYGARLFSHQFTFKYDESSKYTYEWPIEAPVREVGDVMVRFPLLDLDDSFKRLRRLARLIITTGLTDGPVFDPRRWVSNSRQCAYEVGWEFRGISLFASRKVKIEFVGKEEEKE
ncbi:hypothetical protein LTR95_000642 [Oleoguttula sp. CCFEE 5521]